jgi:hypothetical protein
MKQGLTGVRRRDMLVSLPRAKPSSDDVPAAGITLNAQVFIFTPGPYRFVCRFYCS